ncbi:MAG TPA: alpha/beta hydrolase [Bacillaceae bacterium]
MRKWEAEANAKGAIVIVHGAMEHQGRYGWLAEMWRSNGFHVIMGDLPGQGVTTRTKRGHIDSFDDYIREVKDWVKEAMEYGLPVFMLGHSMGGLISIRLLQEEKLDIAGVLLSSPCLGLMEYPPVALNALSVGLNIFAPELRIKSGLKVDLVTRNQEAIERAMNDSLYVTKVSVRWYRELLKAMKAAFTKLSDFPDVPVLVLQGGDDKIVNKSEVRDWFDRLPVSEKGYKEWPECYHEIFNEPERDMIFTYAKNMAENRLGMLQAMLR